MTSPVNYGRVIDISQRIPDEIDVDIERLSRDIIAYRDKLEREKQEHDQLRAYLD